MSIADELLKLEQLRNSGALTAAEFEDAKYALLHPETSGSAYADPEPQWQQLDTDSDSLGVAANRYVDLETRSFNYSIVVSIIGLLIFLIVLFMVIIPGFSSTQQTPGLPGSGTNCTAVPGGIDCR